jgi:hypothetical protein
MDGDQTAVNELVNLFGRRQVTQPVRAEIDEPASVDRIRCRR